MRDGLSADHRRTLALSFTDVLLVGLAAFRLAYLLVREDGPFDLSLRFRVLVGAEHPGIVNPVGKIFSCVWCAGVWCALLMLVAWQLYEPIVWLGAAAAVVLLADSAMRLPRDED